MSTRAALLAVAFSAALTASARSEIIEQILVKVNGEIFTKSDLENRQVQQIRQREKQIDPANEAEVRKAIEEVTPALLVNVVDEMLVVQRGKELGYKLSDDQFKSVLDNLKSQNKIENDEQLQSALKQENMTMADLRRNLERQMIATRVQQAEIFGRVAVTEDEARKYYDAHLNEFTTPASVMLREILVTVSSDGRGVNVAADEAGRERAEAIRKRLVAGESFEKVVSETSDAPSKANGGLIGPLNVSDLGADFRKLVEGLKVGELTSVVRTQRGYQILKLESSTPTQVLAFDQAREQISERVVTDKRRDEFQKYLVKLRSQAIIDWKNADVKKAYDEGVAAQAKAGAGPAQ